MKSYNITLTLHMSLQNLNQKLLCDNGRCKAANKKFARLSAGSYKLVLLVQARLLLLLE